MRYRYDTETGLYYLQSRYYNPEWGRFINADGALGKPGTLLSYNMFAYCLNNPVNMSDPSGFMPTWAKWAIGAAVVIGVIAVIVLAPEVVLAAGEFAGEIAAGATAVGAAIEESSGEIEETVAKVTEKVNQSNFSTAAKLTKHFVKHVVERQEFKDISNEQEYLNKAQTFLGTTGDSNILSRVATNGDLLRFNSNTNEFGILTKDNVIRTYHVLSNVYHEFETNMEYWDSFHCNY